MPPPPTTTSPPPGPRPHASLRPSSSARSSASSSSHSSHPSPAPSNPLHPAPPPGINPALPSLLADTLLTSTLTQLLPPAPVLGSLRSLGPPSTSPPSSCSSLPHSLSVRATGEVHSPLPPLLALLSSSLPPLLRPRHPPTLPPIETVLSRHGGGEVRQVLVYFADWVSRGKGRGNSKEQEYHLLVEAEEPPGRGGVSTGEVGGGGTGAVAGELPGGLPVRGRFG